MADLPPFLQFNRRPRRTMEYRTGEGGEAPAVEPEKTDSAPALPPAAALPRPVAVEPSAVETAPAVAPSTITEGLAASAPEVTGAERRAMGPAPLMQNAKGETVTRPQFDNTGDREADLENYRQQLGDQRNPKNTNSRWWEALKETGRGFLQGGVFGAAARGIRAAAVPNVDERAARDREIGRVEGEQGKERERRGWQAKLADAQEQSDLRRAQTEKVKVETAEIPKQNEATRAGKAQTRILSQLRVAGRYRRGENPLLDKQIEDVGMSVSDFEKGGKFQWHEAGGQVYTMDAATGKVDYATSGGAAVQDRSKMPNAEGLTPAQAKLDAFRKTALYEQIKQREKERTSREGIAAAGRASADERAAAGRASADKRALVGRRFGLMKLSVQAEKEGKTLEELVNEVQGLGGEVFEDENH